MKKENVINLQRTKDERKVNIELITTTNVDKMLNL